MSESTTDAPIHLMDKELLRNIPMFARLSGDERSELAGQLRAKNLTAGEPLFWVGETGDEMFLVQRGKIRLFYADEAGAEVTLAVLGPGAFFGELSLLDGGPRTATARADTDAILLVLDRNGLYAFLERSPAAAMHMISTLGQRQREAMEKLRGVRNISEQIEETTTPLQRMVDRAAAVGSSGRFLLIVVLFIGIWVLVQTIQTLRLRPDLIAASGFPLDSPPYFFWLGFMVTLASFLLTIFVLNAQKRQAERDRIRDDWEYQVNLKAQVEVMQLHRKVDRLAATVQELRSGTPPQPPDGAS